MGKRTPVAQPTWSRHGILFLALATPTLAAADSADDWLKMKGITPAGYVCFRAESPLAIDGELNDAAWRAAPWTNAFADIEGDHKPRPRFRTRAKLLWDDVHFYIAAELQEPHVWGTLTKHDAVIFHDNDFEVFIDPNGDNHEYYEFEMNALNTGWDLFLPRPYKDGGGANNGWEIPGLQTAVHIDGTLNDPADTDRGWSVEIAIPWKVLAEFAQRPSPPRDGDRWRVNFSRVEWQHTIQNGKYEKVPRTREDNWVWSPQGIIDMHRPERWGFVQFSTRPAGTIAFAPESTLAVRDALMEIYHRQKSYHGRQQRWAASLAALELPPARYAGFPQPPRIELTADGFRATLEREIPGEQRQRWHVRQDSRLWSDGEAQR